MDITLPSHAKINLGLRIVGRRTGGYHLLHTLFQEVDFGDQLTFKSQPTREITFEVGGLQAVGVPADDTNLCLMAAHLLQAATGEKQGAHIILDKYIPPGAGLGGGSSNAAQVLRGLNIIWKLGRDWPVLASLAKQLGADVPFFIRGGLQLGEGIGEALTPLYRRLSQTIVLVMPPFGVNTAWAYGQFAGQESFPPPPGFDQLITQDPIPWKAFTNDFEEVVFARYPELSAIKEDLQAAGAVHAGLSGSGSTVYGLFREPHADLLRQSFAGCQVQICAPAKGV